MRVAPGLFRAMHRSSSADAVSATIGVRRLLFATSRTQIVLLVAVNIRHLDIPCAPLSKFRRQIYRSPLVHLQFEEFFSDMRESARGYRANRRPSESVKANRVSAPKLDDVAIPQRATGTVRSRDALQRMRAQLTANNSARRTPLQRYSCRARVERTSRPRWSVAGPQHHHNLEPSLAEQPLGEIEPTLQRTHDESVGICTRIPAMQRGQESRCPRSRTILNHFRPLLNQKFPEIIDRLSWLLWTTTILASPNARTALRVRFSSSRTAVNENALPVRARSPLRPCRASARPAARQWRNCRCRRVLARGRRVPAWLNA